MPSVVIVCVDCGESVDAESKNRKRCDKCRAAHRASTRKHVPCGACGEPSKEGRCSACWHATRVPATLCAKCGEAVGHAKSRKKLCAKCQPQRREPTFCGDCGKKCNGQRCRKCANLTSSIKTCLSCSKPFAARNVKALRCEVCRGPHEREQNRIKTREYNKTRVKPLREAAMAARGPLVYVIACHGCGTEVTANKHNAKWCPQCIRKARAADAIKRYAARKSPCVQCGMPSLSPTCRKCSVSYVGAEARLACPHPAPCACTECKRAYAVATGRIRNRDKITSKHTPCVLCGEICVGRRCATCLKARPCSGCGGAVEHRACRSENVWCPACQVKRRVESHLEQRSRRRAKRAGVTYQPYRRADIFKRDKYICHLCGLKVLKIGGSDPDAASIDHLVPISQGGTDSAENVRLAHMVCNLRKHTKPMNEQLMLIG